MPTGDVHTKKNIPVILTTIEIIIILLLLDVICVTNPYMFTVNNKITHVLVLLSSAVGGLSL